MQIPASSVLTCVLLSSRKTPLTQNVLYPPQDANFLKLSSTYDVVLAHASLHHFINFEHIFPEIHEHLSPNGVFIAYEPVPRNGMLLWPETKELVDRLFAALPTRFRRLKGAHGLVVHESFPDVDHSQGGFECIRSQDVVPLLERFFDVQAKVSGNAFTRRFVDGGFGANYDLSREEDRALLDLLLAFDDVLTVTTQYECRLRSQQDWPRHYLASARRPRPDRKSWET
jgi:SAM-dependent methyltransferase